MVTRLEASKTYRLHLERRCSVHLWRSNASSIAFEGTCGISSSRRTNGCDHAQSEHLQFADPFVGSRIVRVVSLILLTLRFFPRPARCIPRKNPNRTWDAIVAVPWF